MNSDDLLVYNGVGIREVHSGIVTIDPITPELGELNLINGTELYLCIQQNRTINMVTAFGNWSRGAKYYDNARRKEGVS